MLGMDRTLLSHQHHSYLSNQMHEHFKNEQFKIGHFAHIIPCKSTVLVTDCHCKGSKTIHFLENRMKRYQVLKRSARWCVQMCSHHMIRAWLTNRHMASCEWTFYHAKLWSTKTLLHFVRLHGWQKWYCVQYILLPIWGRDYLAQQCPQLQWLKV